MFYIECVSKVKFAVFSCSGKSKFAGFDTHSCFLGLVFWLVFWLVLGLFLA